MSCWASTRSATPWAKAVSPQPQSATIWPGRHRFSDNSGVGDGVEIDGQFARPIAQRAACLDKDIRVRRLTQRKAGFVELLPDARCDEDRLCLGADADELAVR